MSSQKQGLKYEHDISADLHDDTANSIKTYRCGFSGNGRIPQPDILVSTDYGNWALELKKTGRERFYIDSEDIAQLYDCTNENTKAAFVIKFLHREPLVFFPFETRVDAVTGNVEKLSKNATPQEIAEHAAKNVPKVFNPRGTKTGNIGLDKPTTDQWCSSRAGRKDHKVIKSRLGLRYGGGPFK